MPLVDEAEVDVQGEVDDLVRSINADEQAELAVPTEMLQETVSGVLELSSDYHTLGIAKLITGRPKRLLASIYLAAIVLTVWVLLTPGDKFSVSEDLFIARADPDVRSFYDQGKLETASLQLLPTYVYPADRKNRRRMSPSAEAVTLVYERRGLGSRNVLGLRQLMTIHDFEKRLWEWSVQSGVCSTDGGGGPDSGQCLPMDSFLSYLYPSLETVGEGGQQRKLHLDGRMRVDDRWLLSTCADPPFSSHDVADTLSWLASQRRDGNVEDDGAIADEDDEEELSTEKREGGAYSRYLRSTLYLQSGTMSTARWYQLASMLYGFASRPWTRSFYVRLYYGGAPGLMTAGLLVLLTYDLLLLLVAVGAVGLYMRLYFGQWRLALLASLQMLISFPFMLFIVCVLLGQQPLSAFAAASLWVCIGVVSLRTDPNPVP